ncbi:MAG TPA: hypothetical protein VMZ28_31130 [Kofleriaceae bacterium]|nr:hypothetical protein [Kofleriaceae bacterium]
MRAGTLVGAAVLLGAGSAAAHVAPSERENNRYVVLAPVGDRLRLAYVVYMGEEPGRAARARIDRDRDGTISDDEAQRYAGEVAAQVAPRLAVTVDSAAVPVRWHSADLGIDDRSTAAGSFAIDLVAWFCFDRAAAAHTVRFQDRFDLPTPGESELRAEESPGIAVTRSTLGAEPAAATRPRLDFRWRGGPGPAAQGYELDFTVDPGRATFLGPCPPPMSAPKAPRRRWPFVLAIGAVMVLAALAVRWKIVRARTGS